MKRLGIVFILIALIFLQSCTQQGRKTHLVFESEKATYGELDQSLEELKIVMHQGATHEKFRGVRSLRHIEKYFQDPAKREMAVRGLVFMMAFSDDSDVEELSLSRLETILENQTYPWALKAALIEAQKDVVLGQLGYIELDSSIFSDEVDRTFVYPEESAREEALEFLIDHFDTLPLHLQYQTLQAFGDILAQQPLCLEYDGENCEETDEEQQAEWKQDLLENFEGWLEQENLPKVVKFLLVRLAEENQSVKDQGSGETWMAYWQTNKNIPSSIQEFVAAATDKMAQNKTITLPENAEGKVNYIDLNPENSLSFWYQFGEKILTEQLFEFPVVDPLMAKEQEGADKVQEDTGSQPVLDIPANWLFSSRYASDEQDSLVLKSIIYHHAIGALKQGFSIQNSQDAINQFQKLLQKTPRNDVAALARNLEVLGYSFPSFASQGLNIDPLVQTLSSMSQAAFSLHQQRLYYKTLIRGYPYFPQQIEPTLCSFMETTDILTQHQIKEWAKEALTEKKAATVDSPKSVVGTDLNTFCGLPLFEISPTISDIPLAEQKPQASQEPAEEVLPTQPSVEAPIEPSDS